MRVGSLALVLAILSACASTRDSGDLDSGDLDLGDLDSELTWTPKESNPALQRGVTVHGSYYPSICPFAPTWYVAKRDGSHVRTFDELRAVLRPIDTVERALAYRDLLGDIQLERDELLDAQRRTTALDFHPGPRPFFGVYVQANADKWKVGTEPVIETVGETIVITQPSYRYIDSTDAEGKPVHLGFGNVELVQDTFHRDGRYERHVVRTLEEGEAARIHQPAPLW